MDSNKVHPAIANDEDRNAGVIAKDNISESSNVCSHEHAEPDAPASPHGDIPTSEKAPEDHDQTESYEDERTRARHIELGRRGENAACAFLERHGFDILDRNWVCPAGEVDIVIWDGYALRFVEVKTRSGTGKGFPEEAVNAEKRSRYERIAEYYLRNFERTNIPVFFDIIGIVATGEGRAFLRYHRDAFGKDY